MFNFDFTFLSDPFFYYRYHVGLLTVGGTALATFLACAGKMLMKSQTKIINNEELQSTARNSLNQLLLSYNNLFHYRIILRRA